MPPPSELQISEAEERLRLLEQRFAEAMKARGFDPSQGENLALTSSLAKLFQEREDLRAKIAALRGEHTEED